MSVYAQPATGRDCSTVLEAYERLAPVYDLLTAGYDHPTWLDSLEALALEHGLRGRRLLDVACGTGKSFLPMLARGYSVSACDVSPAMVELAREKVVAAGARAHLFVADMRALPPTGPVDLITCLDDAVNYLLSAEGLAAALRGMARALGPGGLAVFDVNTVATYRSSFASDFALDGPDSFLCWRGEAGGSFAAGEVAEAAIEVFQEEPDGRWRRTTSRHVQRHHPREDVEEAIEGAGLELVAVRGQARGARLERHADELEHPKLVYLAKRDDSRRSS
jgi:ubiquinone/menaquinone biosynthesis C-methylase UbiE